MALQCEHSSNCCIVFLPIIFSCSLRKWPHKFHANLYSVTFYFLKKNSFSDISRKCISPNIPVKVWANTILTESSPELSHGGLILKTLTLRTVHSQDELTLWACSELSAATPWWAHRVILRAALSKLTVWVANSRKAHSKLTMWAHLVSSLRANWVSSK